MGDCEANEAAIDEDSDGASTEPPTMADAPSACGWEERSAAQPAPLNELPLALALLLLLPLPPATPASLCPAGSTDALLLELLDDRC